MKNKLLVQQFIEQHPIDWEKLLQEKPYCLLITRDTLHGKDLVMFKYNMVESSFAEPIVCECRGLILDAKTFEVVSFPFTKFFNAHELYAANLDWKTAKVATKVDGSLMKVVNINGNLLISTNGTIDAFKASIAEQIGCPYKSFGDIAFDVLSKKGISADQFEPNFTYMFELVSPYTKIVIPYKETDLYYLGRRNNTTFKEEHFSEDPFNGVFKTPEIYPLQTLDQCLTATAVMPWNEEGYVACDANFNRVKVKSPAYCAIHHMKGNGKLSYERGIDIVRSNEISEIVAYFPEFKNHLDDLKEKLKQTLSFLDQAWANYLTMDSKLSSRKDKAIEIQRLFKSFSGIGFALLDHKINSPKEWLETCPSNKLVKFLGYKD